jgi:hypothetical protein
MNSNSSRIYIISLYKWHVESDSSNKIKNGRIKVVLYELTSVSIVKGNNVGFEKYRV